MNTFSPEGRLFQARPAPTLSAPRAARTLLLVTLPRAGGIRHRGHQGARRDTTLLFSLSRPPPQQLGSTAIGIRTPTGVVLAVEKRVTSPLLEPSSIEKIMEVDSHLGCAMSGLTADARTLIDHGRVEAQNHRFSYNEPLPLESASQALCDLALRFGESGDDGDATMSRPFGVALLLAGCDSTGPGLFHADPSGTSTRCDAKAIGAGSEGAQTTLSESFRPDMTLDEACTLALSTLKAVMEEKVSATNVDIAVVAPTYRLFTQQQVQEVIERL